MTRLYFGIFLDAYSSYQDPYFQKLACQYTRRTLNRGQGIGETRTIVRRVEWSPSRKVFRVGKQCQTIDKEEHEQKNEYYIYRNKRTYTHCSGRGRMGASGTCAIGAETSPIYLSLAFWLCERDLPFPFFVILLLFWLSLQKSLELSPGIFPFSISHFPFSTSHLPLPATRRKPIEQIAPSRPRLVRITGGL